MIITTIKTYRVAIEANRLDRYVEDIDSKINAKLKDIFTGNTLDKVSWTFSSTTSGEMTISSNKRINYIKMYSDLFKDDNNNTIASYWFATEDSEIESDSALRYKLTLDAFATFGKSFLDILRNKKINVKRYHEDRFVLEDTPPNTPANIIKIMKPNKNLISLKNSDFKVNNTYGEHIKYSNWEPNDLNRLDYHRESFSPSSRVFACDNRVMEGTTIWWKYVVIGVTGEPSYRKYGNSANNKTSIINYYNNLSNAPSGVGLDETKYILPVRGNMDNFSSGESNVNNIGSIINMPAGKVFGMFLSPIKLNFGDRFLIGNNSSLDNTYDNLDISSNNIYLAYTFPTRPDSDNLVFNDLTSAIQLKDSNLRPFFEWDIYNQANSTRNNNAKALLRSIDGELGIYHPNISQLNFLVKNSDEETTIDIVNYLDNKKVVGTIMPDSNGMFLDLNIADHHFKQELLKSQLNVLSSAGATYLNENRQQIEANKAGARLQAKLQMSQSEVQKQQTIGGGGIIGAALSAVNPTNWHFTKHEINNQQSYIEQIAWNNIDKIRAQIIDATAGPPSHTDNYGNSFKNSELYNYPGVFNLMFKHPNMDLVKSIAYHYNKFGYNANKIVDNGNNDELWKSRVKFNFLQIENVKDYYNGELNIDDSIVNLISDTLKFGVRIWHQATIEYDNENVETKLLAIP